MRRALRSMAALLLPLVLGIPCCVALRSRDLPDPGDADLLLAPAEISASENGFVQLEQAFAALDYPTDDEHAFDTHLRDALDGRVEPDERVSAVQRANAPARAALRRALAAERFQLPSDEFEDTLPFEYSRLANLLAIEAQHHARAGRVQESLQASLEVWALAQRIESAEGAKVTDAIVSQGMRKIASLSLRSSLRHLRPTRDAARAAADALDGYRTDPASWSRMWATQYRVLMALPRPVSPRDPALLEIVLPLNPLPWLPRAYKHQPNRTRAGLARNIREAQQESALPCSQITSRSSDPTPWEWMRMALDRNSAGNVQLLMGYPPGGSMNITRCLVDTELAAAQTLLGLRAYQLEHGELPDSLDALVPRQLSALPLDGFDAAPLRYSRETRRLWAPGLDGVDRGGLDEPRPGREAALEPTFPIPF